jgi:hypothetical protein
MNMDSSMCASSGNAPHWEQMDWPQCERHVSRLQARIVKATRAGRWGKVKALQRLLTHSFSGKIKARERPEWMESSGKLREPDTKPSDRYDDAGINHNRCAAFTSRKPTASCVPSVFRR